MTKKPICFVPGRVSPFYFLNYWNNIPHYLHEHGYEIIKFPLTLSFFFNRKKQIESFIEKQTQGLHFVFDDLVVHQILPLNSPHSHSFHLIEPTFLNQPKASTPKPLLSPRKSMNFSDLIDFHIKIPTGDKPTSPGQISSDQLSTPLLTHKIPTKDQTRTFLTSIGLNRLFSPPTILGGGSQATMLSVEPEYLEIFNKVAERDWI